MYRPPFRTSPRLFADFGTLCCIAFVFIAVDSALYIFMTTISSPMSALQSLVGGFQSLALLLAAYGIIWLNGGIKECCFRLGQVRTVLLLVALIATVIGVDSLD